MKNVLVIGNFPRRIPEQITLCKSVNEIDNNLNFIFVVDSPSHAREYTSLCDFSKIIFHDRIRYNRRFSEVVIRKIFGNRFYRILQNTTIAEIYNIFSMLTYYLWVLLRVHIVFVRLGPEIILANSDRSTGIEPIFLKIARKRKIRIIIPFYVNYTDMNGCVKTRVNRPLCTVSEKSPIITRYFAKRYRFPQVLEVNKKKILFFEPSKLFFHDRFGTLSSNPWYMGNGLSDVLCIASRMACEEYQAAGVCKRKMRIIGDVIYDRLRINYIRRTDIRREAIEKYDLSKDSRIIVIALPQLAQHGFLPAEEHWREIGYLVRETTNVCSNVLLSLHPRMNYQDYEFLEKDYNCRILAERLYTMLPVADLFIATYSSTVTWAVLCGINAIVVDFYNLNLTYHDALRTVRIIKARDEFVPQIKSMLMKEQDFSHDWLKLARDIVFDGGTIERYRDLFLEAHTSGPNDK
jgi:hypothetical protein